MPMIRVDAETKELLRRLRLELRVSQYNAVRDAVRAYWAQLKKRPRRRPADRRARSRWGLSQGECDAGTCNIRKAAAS